MSFKMSPAKYIETELRGFREEVSGIENEMERLYRCVQDRDNRITALESENARLRDALGKAREAIQYVTNVENVAKALAAIDAVLPRKETDYECATCFRPVAKDAECCQRKADHE